MDVTHAYEWHGRTMLDVDGEKIGKIDAIYLDQESDQPEWALVNTGLFGTKSSFVPLAGAASSGEDVRVAVDKARVEDAPRIDADGELSPEEEATLFRHYDVPYDESGTVTAQGTPGGRGDRLQAARADPDAERREASRVRLRRYVIEKEREEARLERDGPYADAPATSKVEAQEKVEQIKQTALQKKEALVAKAQQTKREAAPRGAQQVASKARENPLPLAVGGALVLGFLLGRRGG